MKILGYFLLLTLAGAALLRRGVEHLSIELASRHSNNHRNANYHQASDTADTLDYTRMAQVVQAVYGVVVQIESKGAH